MNSIKAFFNIGLALFFTFTAVFGALAQESDSIYLMPKWRIGETMVYRVIDSDMHQNSKGFALNIIQDTQFIFLNPVKIKDNKTLIRVNYSKNKDLEEEGPEFKNFSKNFESVIVVDSFGLIEKVYNWKMFSYKFINANAENYEKGLIDSTAFNFFNSYYSVQQNIEDIILQDLNKMYMVYGYGYMENTNYLIKRKLPNPFMGEALIVKGSSILTKPAGTKYTYLLKNKSGMDESHSKQISNDFLKFKKNKGEEYKFIAPKFYIGNEEEFAYNIAQGRVTSCKITDSLISEQESRIVVTEFKLVDVINP